MSPPQHREKNAKAEGRGPPDEPKDTMATFKALTKRLLKVSPEEVQAQQELYDRAREQRFDAAATAGPSRPKKRKTASTTTSDGDAQTPHTRTQAA
jgi:hypothetical protein